MGDSGPGRRNGGLINRRLAARVQATRRYLLTAVVAGAAATACVVVQAVLLASVVSAVLLHHSSLGSETPRLAGLAAAFVARGLFLWAGEAAAQRTSATVTSELQRQLLRHALELGPAWLAGERTGELSLAATRGTSALDAYFGRYLPQAVLAALAPAALLAWVGWEDWPSLLILLALVALIPVAMIYFGRRAEDSTRRQWRRLSSLSARFLDLLRGLPTLRAFGREDQGRREVAEATDALRQATLGTLRVAFMSALALEFVAGIGTGLVAMVLGLRLLGGQVPLASALAVLLVSPEVFLPLRRAGAEFHASAEGQAAAERILAVLDLPAGAPHAPTLPDARAGEGRPSARATPDPATQPVRVEALTVAYPGRSDPALRQVDADIPPGSHVAVLGPSGAGKSTLLAVLLRFVRPTSGRVLVGGADLGTLDADAWRRRVAWVPQRPQLVSGTVADNLRIADPGAPERRLRGALDAAGLRLTLDTAVGEGGLTLSAGERQRLGIARAWLRDAGLVLLDEPVSHLDAATEAALRASLAPWLDARTVVVAAHRPELVGRIDSVLQLGAPGRQERVGTSTGGGAGS